VRTAQVQSIDARGTGTDARVGILWRRTTDHRRQGVDELSEVRDRRRLQFLDTDHRERCRCLEAGALDARTGHDDLVERIGDGCLLRYDGR
jgi:hypothetical protein